ncbi:MAG: Phosphoribosyltransferase [Candidatus Berkelbacteria bacterium Athens1014_28]|uniref:Phosphoribosyltransferase n=1 Tax=Candidatus Berkelbacteria bacterium Athens1014_28 TaxID=2017145 RepID=A0A554LKP8_9BACT|nr:MAG: Phosphoribosyltransferase [Candidatus Berkelbacteria bacterium Athens1014_28]
MQKIKTIFHFFFDLIFPKNCVGCDVFADTLCAKCREEIKVIETFVCPKCGKINDSGKYCLECRSDLALFGLLISADYRHGPTKEMIHHFKYSGATEFASVLADLMMGRVSQLKNHQKMILVPVPLYFWRQRDRGYNQSEILARIVGKKLGLKIINPLKRKKTKPQVGLSGRARRKNLEGAFKMRKFANVLDKTIILVDDVSTTGTTLEEWS